MAETAATAAAAGAKRRAEPDGDSKAEPPKKARTRTSPRAKLSWTALTPELLGRVAKNLEVGPELVSFCMVVGKNNVSRVVKQAYLYRNDKYLIRAWASPPVAEGDFRRFRENFYTWMDCNEGYWQVKCLGRKADANLYTVTVSKEATGEIKLTRIKYHTCGTICTVADQWPTDRVYSSIFILAIGGIDVSNMPVQEATELLRSEAVCRDGSVRILCVDSLSVLFSHPCNASDRGLDRVVRHLIENGMVDPRVRYHQHKGVTPENIQSDRNMVPLLQYSALRLPASYPVFEYLLTVDGVDVNATMGHSSLIHYLSLWTFASPGMLASFLKHPDLDVNARSSSGHNAVNILCARVGFRNGLDDNHLHIIPHSLMMKKLRLLLEARVDATSHSDSGKTPNDYLNIYEEEIDLREIEGGEQYRKDIHEIRALLDKYI